MKTVTLTAGGSVSLVVASRGDSSWQEQASRGVVSCCGLQALRCVDFRSYSAGSVVVMRGLCCLWQVRSSPIRDQTPVSCLAGGFFTTKPLEAPLGRMISRCLPVS